MLTEKQIELLKLVQSRQGTGNPVIPILPIAKSIQALIDRGYLKAVPLFEPILRQPTGELGLRLTEAGGAALAAKESSDVQ